MSIVHCEKCQLTDSVSMWANCILTFPPTMPVIQTMPCSLTHFSESAIVTTPTSSKTLLYPSGRLFRTSSAMAPLSMKTSSAPFAFNMVSLSGFRVVTATEAHNFIALQRAAVAKPMEVVPPRIRRWSSGLSCKDSKSEPHAVLCESQLHGRDSGRRHGENLILHHLR